MTLKWFLPVSNSGPLVHFAVSPVPIFFWSLFPLSHSLETYVPSLRTQSGLLRWLSGKEPTCQCRRCGFDPWIGKVPWKRKLQPTPVFLPGKSHGQRGLVGYSPWGHKKIWHDWVTKQHGHSLGLALTKFHVTVLLIFPNGICLNSNLLKS